jgi:DNA-binding transcriptional regulator YiaG
MVSKDHSARRSARAETRKKKAAEAFRTEMASKIFETRKELGITQAELALRLTKALPDRGTAKTTVVEWERGRRQPSPQKLVTLGAVAPPGKLRDWFFAHAGVTRALVEQYAEMLTSEPARPGESVTVLSYRVGCEGKEASSLSFSLPPQFATPRPDVGHFIVTDRTLGAPFSAGDVILLDKSRTGSPSIAPLLGEIVLIGRSEAEKDAGASKPLWDYLVGKLIVRGKGDGTGIGMSWSVRVVAWSPPDMEPWPHEPALEFEVGQHRTIAPLRQSEMRRILLAGPEERESVQRQLLQQAEKRAAWECTLMREYEILGRVTGWLQLLRHGGG